MCLNFDQDAMRLAQAQATPVPEFPAPSIQGEEAEERTHAEDVREESATEEMETDQESN